MLNPLKISFLIFVDSSTEWQKYLAGLDSLPVGRCELVVISDHGDVLNNSAIKNLSLPIPVRQVLNEKHQGRGRSLIKAMFHCSGDFCIFLDSGSKPKPDLFTLIINFIDEQNPDVISLAQASEQENAEYEIASMLLSPLFGIKRSADLRLTDIQAISSNAALQFLKISSILQSNLKPVCTPRPILDALGLVGFSRTKHRKNQFDTAIALLALRKNLPEVWTQAPIKELWNRCLFRGALAAAQLNQPEAGVTLTLSLVRTGLFAPRVYRLLFTCVIIKWLGIQIETRVRASEVEAVESSRIPEAALNLLPDSPGMQSNTGALVANKLILDTKIHERGHCLFGPDYSVRQAGKLSIEFELGIDNKSEFLRPMFTLDIYDNSADKILAIKDVSPSMLTRSESPVALTTLVEPGQCLEFRVFWHGLCSGFVSGLQANFV